MAYCVLTADPNDLSPRIHNCMSVIIRPENDDTWLDPGLTDPGIVGELIGPPEQLLRVVEGLHVTDSNELLAPILNRMPIISRPEDHEAWLDPGLPDPGILSE